MKVLTADWNNTRGLPNQQFTCGHCGVTTGSVKGYETTNEQHHIYICGGCNRPNIFCFNLGGSMEQFPGTRYGQDIRHLPEDINALYNEIRSCYSTSGFTAAVLACRKMLMHVAVEKGAKAGQNFFHYAEWLVDNHYVPPAGERWLHYIRQQGNEANHAIVIKTADEAQILIDFVELLLRNVYEAFGKLPAPIDNE